MKTYSIFKKFKTNCLGKLYGLELGSLDFNHPSEIHSLGFLESLKAFGHYSLHVHSLKNSLLDLCMISFQSIIQYSCRFQTLCKQIFSYVIRPPEITETRRTAEQTDKMFVFSELKSLIRLLPKGFDRSLEYQNLFFDNNSVTQSVQ